MITQKPISSAADEVLNQIEVAAEKKFLPIIGPHKGKFLVEEVRKAKPLHVLEVGTLIGYSAVLMGKELGDDAEIVTIEIHREEAEEAGENVFRANIQPKVKVITGDAIEVIPTLKGPFDFAFIDAEKSEYLQYLQLAEDKILQRCGCVCG
jgi:predicted O-methyltransferase YrrM